jgi:hypothetical protein
MMLRAGFMVLAVSAVLATTTPARAQLVCDGGFWDGVGWVCWTYPLFPGLALAREANPYWRWTRNWGGPNWRFSGWHPM